MKMRAYPKVLCKDIIYHNDHKIGYLQLVSYMTGDSMPHIEFEIEKPWQFQGAMTKELPLYLKDVKKLGYNRLLAIVKQDNTASKSLLEKNGFVEVKKRMNEYIIYILEMRLPKEITESVIQDYYK
jgi:RimJ/RimL family protein N-acetyltransferase